MKRLLRRVENFVCHFGVEVSMSEREHVVWNFWHALIAARQDERELRRRRWRAF
jgi:hypothetical protein